MNELSKLTTDIKGKRGLTLILTKDRARKSITELIATLILKGPLFIVSGDEWLPSFALPYLVFTNTIQVKAIIHGLRTVRASTCYRLLDSLSNTPAQGDPILVLGFLNNFYDPNIRIAFRFSVLRKCCNHLRRIALCRSVIVFVQEVLVDDFDKFLPLLRSVARKTFYLETEPEKSSQPTLF